MLLISILMSLLAADSQTKDHQSRPPSREVCDCRCTSTGTGFSPENTVQLCATRDRRAGFAPLDFVCVNSVFEYEIPPNGCDSLNPPRALGGVLAVRCQGFNPSSALFPLEAGILTQCRRVVVEE